MDPWKIQILKSLNFLQNILYGSLENTNPEISELPTKYSVWILGKYNQTVLIISCIENIKKNFFAGLRPARMQGLKNNL